MNVMKKLGSLVAIVLVVVVLFLAKSHLETPQAKAAPTAGIPSVTVQAVVEMEVADSRKYIGRVDPIQSVILKPQVAGRIVDVHFVDGSAVKEGQLLFTLDDRQFQASVALRKAELAKAEASYKEASAYYERLKGVGKSGVAAADLDAANSVASQAKAAVEQAKASLALAQLDLEYTKVTAPIAGRIGKALITKGNYVTQSDVLANIVQIDPIRVSFSLADRDYLSQLKAFRGDGAVWNATVELPTGETYPLAGQRDFEDTTISDKTGTLGVSLRFANKQGVLVPGTMVRVTARAAVPHMAAAAPQEAICTDRDGDFVYVVDADEIVHQRRVTLGAELGTMREVVSGIGAGEKVVVGGLQALRPDMKVSPMLKASQAAKGLTATNERGS